MSDITEARKIIDRADAGIAALFAERMRAAAEIGEYKREHGLPLTDSAREAEVLSRAAELTDAELSPYLLSLMQSLIRASKAYQADLSGNEPSCLPTPDMPFGGGIIVKRGCAAHADEYLNIGASSRVLVVTDDGVPNEHVQAVASRFRGSTVFTLRSGEENKTPQAYLSVVSELLRLDFTRSDCVIAVGGGVVGDIAGFAAATYMRGIDFYNIPTTCLAQTDASVGGKNGVDLDGAKNILGVICQPKRVLIDTDLLSTLPKRQLANGLAEALKTAMTSDAKLFGIFERGEASQSLEAVIKRSLAVKCGAVMLDEREAGPRMVLNFGHTIGHAIESVSHGELLHGECVAIGMLPMCAPEVRKRLEAVLLSLGLPISCRRSAKAVLEAVKHDKKRRGDTYNTVFVPEIGSFAFRTADETELEEKIQSVICPDTERQ